MNRRLFLLSLIAVGLSGASCRTGGLQPREGYVDVDGGRIWYRIVGSGTRTPLLLLHGGPGSPSYYLDPLDKLADERPVIFYDQLGSGKSDHPANPALWRTERFVDELPRLRAALSLNEVHILGHSWGSMLAVDYMLTRPSGVRSLVLASPCLSVTRWLSDAEALKKTLCPDTTSGIVSDTIAGCIEWCWTAAFSWLASGRDEAHRSGYWNSFEGNDSRSPCRCRWLSSTKSCWFVTPEHWV